MRFRELQLMAFGPFTDTSLTFESQPAMHVIYGPNEAGKSTALRAITALLYGVPPRTRDSHVHDNKKLRVGGVLESGSGEPLAIVRRKGLKRTLLAPDETPMDDALLARALCGVSKSLFVTMFGLDHVTLREGAQALLRGDGDVGESLFDAGGARGVGDVLDSLYEEADALYKPRGQSPLLNDALRRYKEAKQRIVLKEMLPTAWTAQREATAAARAEYDVLVAKRQRLGAERSRLQRALRALPQLSKRRELLQRLEQLGEVPKLAADASERRLSAEQDRDVSARHSDQVREEIAALTAEREQLAFDEALAELDDFVVRDVSDRLGNHRKAEVDLPKRRAAWEQLRREAEALLRDLGRDMPLDDVRSLQLDKPARARLNALRNTYGRHAAELEAAEGARDEMRAKLSVAQKRLASLPELEDHGQLRTRVSEATRLADRLTADEAVLEADEDKLHERSARVTTELAELKNLGAPSPTDLERARAARDEYWKRVEAGGNEVPREALDAYRTATLTCDHVADQLWQQADKVAKHARLSAEHDAVERERTVLQRRRSTLEDQRRAAEDDFPGEGDLRSKIHRLALQLETEAEQKRERATTAQLVHDMEAEIAVLETRVASKHAALTEWKAAWREAVLPLGLSEEASVDEVAAAEVVLADLFARLRDADELSRRIEGMRRDATEFEQIVKPLVARFCADLGDEPLDRAAEALLQLHRTTLAARERREAISDKLAAKKAQLQQAEDRKAQAEETLRDLVRVARVANATELPAAEERAQQRERLDASIRDTEEAIFTEGTIDELVAMTRDIDVDETRSRLSEIEDEHREVNEQCERLLVTIGANERGLQELEQREGALGAAAIREETLSTIQRQASRFAVVRLAAVLLEREIERYRKHNQGPILARANVLFPRLTLGGYTELSVGFDDRDEPALRCTRADGAEVDVVGLSDGTRDQLYLALRLASLERYAERSELMPFIVDDVLIHFDDDRARAALEVLAEFSERSQVLFFTHHQRLVELAKELGEDRVAHHRLPDPRLR